VLAHGGLANGEAALQPAAFAALQTYPGVGKCHSQVLALHARPNSNIQKLWLFHNAIPSCPSFSFHLLPSSSSILIANSWTESCWMQHDDSIFYSPWFFDLFVSFFLFSLLLYIYIYIYTMYLSSFFVSFSLINFHGILFVNLPAVEENCSVFLYEPVMFCFLFGLVSIFLCFNFIFVSCSNQHN